MKHPRGGCACIIPKLRKLHAGGHQKCARVCKASTAAALAAPKRSFTPLKPSSFCLGKELIKDAIFNHTSMLLNGIGISTTTKCQ